MPATYQRVSQNKWEGVYYLESKTKEHKGKPDICYVVNFKISGRKVWEKVGWKSNGITPQAAQQYRAKRIQEIQLGAPVLTAAERKEEVLKRNRTIGEIAKLYFETKGHTLKGYKADVNRYEKHIEPIFKNLRVPTITPFDMESLKRSMAAPA